MSMNALMIKTLKLHVTMVIEGSVKKYNYS